MTVREKRRKISKKVKMNMLKNEKKGNNTNNENRLKAIQNPNKREKGWSECHGMKVRKETIHSEEKD
jgi:hypothetical protein